jgi:peptidoglycan hydrolase CwlO-like protein
MKKAEPTEILLDLQGLQNQCDALRLTVTDLKDQVKATNVELVKVNLEISRLNLVIELLKEALKPLQKFYSLSSGIIVTALVGALLSLILIK